MSAPALTTAVWSLPCWGSTAQPVLALKSPSSASAIGKLIWQKVAVALPSDTCAAAAGSMSASGKAIAHSAWTTRSRAALFIGPPSEALRATHYSGVGRWRKRGIRACVRFAYLRGAGPLQGQRGRVLDRFEHERRLHVDDDRERDHLFHQEARVRVEVGRDDLERVVPGAGQLLAGEHLRPALHRLAERAARVLGLLVDPDFEVGGEPQADLTGIDDRRVADDHPGFLEPPQAPQARRGRERDLGREVGVLHASMFLEDGEHAPVGPV